MKAIKNESELLDILRAEDDRWQQRVFANTGVFVHFSKHGGILLSNCGYVDLDRDAEYLYAHGRDETKYVSLRTCRDLEDYILNMQSYRERLVDESYGCFSKSELFWATYSQIILPAQNQKRSNGTEFQDWGLYSINVANAIPLRNAVKTKEAFVFDMALVDYDSCEIEIPKEDDMELSSVLDLLVKEMNAITEGIDGIPHYCVYRENAIIVPKTFHEIANMLNQDGVFYWLR